MFKEFKEFISKGNIMDLAVGIIIGSAFTAIVNSVVKDILTPLLGLLIGGINFGGLSVKIGDAAIAYGNFIQNIIVFFLTALAVFFMMKGINSIRNFGKKKEESPIAQAPTTKTCPFCMSDINIKATRCPHCTSVLEDQTEI